MFDLFYKSQNKLNHLKIPNINPSIDFNDLPYVSLCIPTYNENRNC